MEGWSDFFVAEVGAAAALAGLLVVAISINIEKIMTYPGLPSRAAQTIVVIGTALGAASFALIPGQPAAYLGGELIACGLFVGIMGIRSVMVLRGVHKPGDPMSWIAFPVMLIIVSSIPDLVGGGLLAAGDGAGVYWIAIGIILSFAGTLQNGWVLLVEILR